MRAGAFLVLVALLGVVYSQTPPTPPNFFPIDADGFETIFVDDMSFVNEISVQTAGANFTNVTFYIYGDSRLRTVFTGREFHVGVTPNENWHLPFIDFHTFLDANGQDIWGVGPINALYARNRTSYSGFQFEIAVISTKGIPGTTRGRIFLEQPLGFEGTFYTTRVVGFDPTNVHGYFAGFFPPVNSTGNQMHFGVRRAHFNVSVFNGPYDPFNSVAWTSDPNIDDAIIYPSAQFVTYNSDFKPFLLHARGVNNVNDPPNSTYLVVVDPYLNTAQLVRGNVDQTVPLNVTDFGYIPTLRDFGRIVSAVVYGDYLIVGISAPGGLTGWLDVLHISNLTQVNPPVWLPTNFSDPRALVLDYFATTPTLYIGMNGGHAILKMDLNTFQITGYQNLPPYLHRTWRGTATHEHIYFATNEQHTKVYRMYKGDFCPSQCMEFGYCKEGKCVCGPNWELRSGKCEWKNYIIEKNKVKRDKGGEIALGILWALTLIAAGAGWYMVWKNRRGYQAV